MVVKSVSNSNNRREDFEGAVSGTNNIGSGPGPTADPDFFYQGTQSWGRRINNASADNGFGLTTGTTVDMTVADNRVWVAKVLLTNVGALGTGGIQTRLGSSSANFYGWKLRDDGSQGDDGEFQYPLRGGWLIEPIDPNVAEWRDADVGTTVLTAVDYFAVTGFVTATSNNENIFLDSLDLLEELFLVGGTAPDPSANFADFVEHDEGQTTSGRFGLITSLEGVLFLYGTMVIGETSGGTATGARFVDANKTLVFPGGRVNAGFNGIDVRQSGVTASVFRLTNVSIVGEGRNNLARWFSTAGNVTGGATDSIDFELNHSYKSGDAVLYSKNGGTEAIGLTDATVYYIEVIDSSTFALHNTRFNSLTGATRISLTASAAANSESHNFTRQPDTRPDFIATDGTNGIITLNSCNFERFRRFAVGSTTTFTSCRFVDCNEIDLSAGTGTGTLDACTITRHTTDQGASFITTSTLAEITDCDFDIGTSVYAFGHAIEIDTAGTYAFVGNRFTGYGPTEEKFNASTAVDATLDEIDVGTDFTTGSEDGDPIYYEDKGGTVLAGLVDTGRYYIRVSDTSSGTIALYRTRDDAINDTQRIALTAGSDELHEVQSAKAAIVNTSGGAVTINVSGGGDLPSVRSVGTATTNAVNAVTVTINAADAGTLAVIENARVYLEVASGGQLPFEESVTITRSGSVATVTHASHGLLTGDKVRISGADQSEYNGVFTITFVGRNVYTFTVTGTPTTPATGTIVSTFVVFNDLTNASGLVTNAGFPFLTDQPVSGRVRKGTTSPLYKTAPISGTITDLGFETTIFMVPDE